MILICDGAVRFATRDISPGLMRAMVTLSGGEIVDLDKRHPED
jgi:hypothetical protein